jgi:hypothetical protein
MADALDHSALERWRREPTAFISEVLINPETRRRFDLLPAERQIFVHAYPTNDNGRLVFPERCVHRSRRTSRRGR